MIVIGTDTHKQTHTCGAVDALTAASRGELTVPARKRSFGKLLRWARALDSERVWAIEDCRHVSGAFERFLIARGSGSFASLPSTWLAHAAPHASEGSPIRSMRSASPEPR